MRAPFVALLALLGTLVAGMWIGGHGANLPGPLRDFVRGDDDLAVVQDAIDRIDADYYRPVPRQKLADAAIGGVVKSLDQFSNYLDRAKFAKFQEETRAQFVGIGVSVGRVRDGLRIGTVYKGSPARAAGLRSGDVLVAADGQALGGKATDAAAALVRGPSGSQVRLTVRRGRSRFQRQVRRAEVAIPPVDSRLVKRGGRRFAVLRLAAFTEGAHGYVRLAVRRALQAHAAGLVLDLRHNPGGLVEEARLVASVFLRSGKVVTTRGRAVPERVYRATGDPDAPDLPMVVLVDGDSASAAEIVTGALQDTGRATVVGAKTYGKGVFQEVIDLPNGGALDLTVGQYFTPKGRNLGRGAERGAGIAPDVPARDDPRTPRRDEALDRAVAVLAGR